jgi:hypothetical protein
MSQSIQSGGQGIEAPPNGQSAVHDLFALTDEQILEIEPEAQDLEVTRGPLPVAREENSNGRAASSEPAANLLRNEAADRKPNADSQTIANSSSTEHGARNTGHGAQRGLAVPQEPPRWVAEAMNDPQRGGEARAFWEGSQKAQQEAAAYREVFAKPEEARSAAERARVLDDIDRAYFGVTGSSPEQTSAARSQFAQMMLHENPAAFREMVFAGLQALEQAGKQGSREA